MRSKKVFTVPNILSALRIILIPIFVYFFFANSIKNNYLWAALIFAFSSLTDVIDGFVARHWGLITELGKVLDPLADKLTQASVVVCLSTKQPLIIPLVIIMFAKEIMMLIGAIWILKIGKRPGSAKWWGKLTTVVLFISLILFMISGLFNNFLPPWAIITLVTICGLTMIFSLISYYPVFKELKNTNGR